ncbi:MAG: HIT domain-containing protein [Bdellovibrionales bacterium]|nr:HIT domain-containing protein [Bdellovibrionales bacterium]
MKRLWAPWRLAYIKGTARAPGCPFCLLPKEKTMSEKNLVLWRDDDLFVVLNKFPYNPSHLMVIPRAHISTPEDLEPEIWTKVAMAQRACLDILRREINPQGFNLGMNLGKDGGAGIPEHIHWHVIPRWEGDTNFFPLIAETKSIASHNETVYRQLKPAFVGFEKKLRPAKIKGK